MKGEVKGDVEGMLVWRVGVSFGERQGARIIKHTNTQLFAQTNPIRYNLFKPN